MNNLDMKPLKNIIFEKLKINNNTIVGPSTFYELAQTYDLELYESGFSRMFDYKIYDIPQNSKFLANTISFSKSTVPDYTNKIIGYCNKIEQLCKNVLHDYSIKISTEISFNTRATQLFCLFLFKQNDNVGKIKILKTGSRYQIGLYTAKNNKNVNKNEIEIILTNIVYNMNENIQFDIKNDNNK